ncbi:hypothetical protein B9Z65_3678 [Elsinoe australis]|uniref:Uncharacterized protein n=1 Tax=Elsinoe australis TaxID=40998 RepID=A0A2P8AFV3_9PEZI|nr:hypothetical protein B9Z65_3678 [Elsinoe australis]
MLWRKSTRFVVAALVLLTVIVLADRLRFLPGTTDRIASLLAWTHQTPPPPIIPANNTSPPQSDLAGDKIVVTGKQKDEDASWITQDLPDWQNAVYSVDDPTAPLHTLTNKGREANTYLTYLVENYDHLPSVIAFIHPHKGGYPKAWHTDADDYSNVKSLSQLNLDFVLKSGYVNLRCIAIPGCPDEIQPFRDWDNMNRISEHAYGQVWKGIFNNTDVPQTVGAACCAQFAVSRAQVHARPKSDYERYLRYLIDTDLSDDIIGRIYEYMWHIMFGRGPVYCPELEQCYRDVYNREP